MKKLIIDVDFTISRKVDSYENAQPNIEMITMIREYKKKGYYISLFSARNMKTYNGDITLIEQKTRPILETWLIKNNIPFDELILGKPWNDEGFYIDDNAVRPLEFLSKSEEEILETLEDERKKLWKL